MIYHKLMGFRRDISLYINGSECVKLFVYQHSRTVLNN